jgi:lipid II:glycine glycyltransferase (peptidoglycan interpeptide bridge formation enzyme)
MYGWKSLKLSNGAILRLTKYIFFNRAQLLRPVALKESDLAEIDSLCKKNKVLFVKISPNQNQNTKILESFGYKKTKKIDIEPNTMIIDLSKETKNLRETLTSGCRYSINKSNKAEDRVEFIRNPNNSEITKYYNLVGKRGKKKKFYVQNLNDHVEKVKAFGKDAFIGNVYNKKGEILGTKFFLCYKRGVWGLHAATTPLGQKSCGGYKLLWDSFEYFKKLGYKTMDLGGITDERTKKYSKEWAGYTYFKKQFNGEVTTFPMPYIKYFSPFQMTE